MRLGFLFNPPSEKRNNKALDQTEQSSPKNDQHQTATLSIYGKLMAEAMINEKYRESIQSLDKMIDEKSHPISYDPNHAPNITREGGGSNSNIINKRVTHDPRTVVIEIPENKRRKVSSSITGKQVIEGKLDELFLLSDFVEVKIHSKEDPLTSRFTPCRKPLAMLFPMKNAEKRFALQPLRLITVCSVSTMKRSSSRRILH